MNAFEPVTDYETLSAQALVEKVAREAAGSPIRLTSSFQTEDMVVLHMLRLHLPDIPVIFLETGYHFNELLAYRDRMTAEWGLNLIDALPLTTLAEHEAKHGLLYIVQPTECCKIRKVEPLMRHLEPFDWWFTGLRREQSPTRAGLRKVEDHRTPTGKQMKKVSGSQIGPWRRWTPTPRPTPSPGWSFTRADTPASAASHAPQFLTIRPIRVPAAGVEKSLSAASIPSLKKWYNFLAGSGPWWIEGESCGSGGRVQRPSWSRSSMPRARPIVAPAPTCWSAPRETCFGTISGGCLEAEVVSKPHGWCATAPWSRITPPSSTTPRKCPSGWAVAASWTCCSNRRTRLNVAHSWRQWRRRSVAQRCAS